MRTWTLLGFAPAARALPTRIAEPADALSAVMAADPTCTSVGVDAGFKLDPAEMGTFAIHEHGASILRTLQDGLNLDSTCPSVDNHNTMGVVC